jgi:phospho-N-acetylmuramoyl-pentapeptide-transferase
LTDGLDGLAGGHLAIAFAVSGLFIYFSGHSVFAKYFELFFTPGVGEITVLIFAILGALLGFLWWNNFPAQIFMGDSGSLSLGALLGFISILGKFELFLPILGFLFVIEALSVIIQVAYFKITGGKRIFRMAPLHHHFELGGMSEPKVVARFIIVAIIFGAIAIFGIKPR